MAEPVNRSGLPVWKDQAFSARTDLDYAGTTDIAELTALITGLQADVAALQATVADHEARIADLE